jgi:uncharacterized membrane protein
MTEQKNEQPSKELPVPPHLQKELEIIEHDEKKRNKILALFNLHQYHHSGPLPSPDFLKQYDLIIPGLAERIVKMAEDQQSHRLSLENKVISSQLDESKRGQFLGVTVATLCIIASFTLSLLGHEYVAGIIGGTTVIGLVTVFVLGKKEQRKDLQKKSV